MAHAAAGTTVVDDTLMECKQAENMENFVVVAQRMDRISIKRCQNVTYATPAIPMMFLAFTSKRARYIRCIESTLRYYSFCILCINFFRDISIEIYIEGIRSFRNIWMNTLMPFCAHSSVKMKPTLC